MDDFFQIYHNSVPELNELVLIKFTKKNDTHFEGELIEYNYNAIMSYNDATKKKKVYSWNKIVPLNKNILAKIEAIHINDNIVQVSIAYNNINIKDQLKPFNDNKILLSLIKKVCYKLKLDFNYFWKQIIHYLDKIRKDGDDENLLIFVTGNNLLLVDILGKKYENHKEIMDCISDNIINTNQKITSKIGLISTGGINITKQVIEEFVKDITFSYNFKYDSAPYYILESFSYNSTPEDHQEFIECLESVAKENKIFTKIEYIGKA